MTRRSNPQTPALGPKIISEDEDPVPDFFLDDTAGVGSPMSFSPHSPDWSLKRSYFSFRPFSPTPSLSGESDDSSYLSDCDSLSAVSNSSFQSPETETTESNSKGKSKKAVRFVEKVEILPYIKEDEKEEGDLKPPQVMQARVRKVPGSADLKLGDIGIMYGLGRAGSGSFVHLHEREKREMAKRTKSPPIESSDEEQDEEMLRRKSRKYHQIPRPLYPPPIWRTSEQLQREQQQRLRAFLPLQRTHSLPEHYEDQRYILGTSSPTNFSPINSPPLSPPLPPLDRMQRQQSGLRSSFPYNWHLKEGGANIHTTRFPWREGELKYEEWVRRQREEAARLSLWSVRGERGREEGRDQQKGAGDWVRGMTEHGIQGSASGSGSGYGHVHDIKAMHMPGLKRQKGMRRMRKRR